MANFVATTPPGLKLDVNSIATNATAGLGLINIPKYDIPGSNFSTGVVNSTSNATRLSARVIPPSSTDKDLNNSLETSTTQPISGQKNDTPLKNGSETHFENDNYRNGADQSNEAEFSDPDLARPRTLSMEADSIGEDTLASMSLAVVPGGTTDAGALQGLASNTDLVSAYTRFFLQSAVESEQEKYQVVETFTGYYAFFYGKRPPVYRYSGVLLSDENYRWNNDFKFIYENYFRGTSAVSLNAEVVIIYDGRIVTGFPLNLTMQQDAVNPKTVSFAMDVLIVDHVAQSFSKDEASLIAKKTAELAQLKQEIADLTASLSNPSTDTNQAVGGSLQGLSAASPFGVPSVGNVDNTALG